MTQPTIILAAIVGALVATSCVTRAPTSQIAERTLSKKHTRYIVTLKEDVNVTVREFVAANFEIALFKELSAQPAYYYEQLKAFAVDIGSDVPEETERALGQIAGVKNVGRDRLMRIESVPWGLDRIDQRSPALDGNYNASLTGRGVSVFVVDTGVRISHHDFGGRAYVAYDAVDDDDNTGTPSNGDRQGEGDGMDCNGHGTHVAGIVGGTRFGVAKMATIMSVRVIGRNEKDQIVGAGCAGFGRLSEILDGIDWITAYHRKAGNPSVVNLSFGGDYDTNFNLAVERSVTAGITYIVAAGNDNQSLTQNSPASAAGILPVGASEIRAGSDQRWALSNFGGNILFAPGVAIRSAFYHDDDDDAVKDGTSMAAPHVSGIAAQYLETHQQARPAEVLKAIEDNATTGRVVNPGPGSRNLLAYSAFQ